MARGEGRETGARDDAIRHAARSSAIRCRQSIGPGVDIKPFLAAWVPDSLRNAALKRLWSLDPEIRDAVGDALDYAFDYNRPETIPGFGALAATDAREIVSRLFAPSAQQAAEAEARAREAPSGMTEGVANEAVSRAETPEPHDPAPRRGATRRRHGGALPRSTGGVS